MNEFFDVMTQSLFYDDAALFPLSNTVIRTLSRIRDISPNLSLKNVMRVNLS